MAKKRSKRSSSDSPKHRSLNPATAKVIRWLIGFTVWSFFFASVFVDSGIILGWVHDMYRLILGVVTPVFAVVLLCWAFWKVFPGKFAPRVSVVAGLLLTTVSIAAFAHLLAPGNPAIVASLGNGGGWVGYFIANALTIAFGVLVAQVLVVILALIGLVMALDRVLQPLLAAAVREHGTEEDDKASDQPQKTNVEVLGEVEPNPMQRIQQRFMRPTQAKPPTQVPVLSLKQSPNWSYPPLDLFKVVDERPNAGNIQKRMELIQKTLRDFNIDVTMTDVRIGPTVSQYTLRPADGVKLTQITARQDDLALALAAESLRVEAPIPGKSLVGVEIPNEKKAAVGMRDLLASKTFRDSGTKLAMALGRDAAGQPIVADLTRMPHVLIAGATGSGKSVCINALIVSLLMHNSPDELRMILVDPKRVELTLYNGVPHLLTPVITEPKDTVRALSWSLREMDRRYQLLARTGKKNIEQYNQSPDLAEGKMPFIVVVIDELADLMMVSAREVESKIVRLAQMSRAVGIHLVVATQRPSVDVITGLIKANIPTRIAFSVTSQVDSRTIIDMAGAEKLLGQGDMLYLTTEFGKPRRVQGVFCREDEISSIIGFIRQQEPEDRYDPTVLEEQIESRFVSAGSLDEDEEMLVQQAYDFLKRQGKASTSMLQTNMRLGYAKAKRIMNALEERGLIGPEKGAGKHRDVYAGPVASEPAPAAEYTPYQPDSNMPAASDFPDDPYR